VKLAAIVCLATSVLFATRVSAQTRGEQPPPVVDGLKISALVWAACVTADQITTYQFSSQYRDILRETNPMIRGLDRHPVLLVTAGSAIDAAAGWVAYRYLGRSHPRLAKTAFFAAAAYRAYLAGYNMQMMGRAEAIRAITATGARP